MADHQHDSETNPETGLGSVRPTSAEHQRRYEAVRAYVLEGAPLAEAAARFGYAPSALVSLVRDFRGGKFHPRSIP